MSTPLHHLEPVGLDFLSSAPVRFAYTAPLPAPADTVFAAISADPSTWTWFPGLTNARYESSAPFGVGTLRSVGDKVGRWADTVIKQRPLGAGDGTPPGATQQA